MFLECLGGTEWLTACGDNVCIPASLATYTRIIYNAIRIITPLVLIIIGMYDMAKAVTTKNADDVKKAQNLLVKKAIAAAIVFFLFTFVSWMITILSDTGSESDKATNQNILSCLEQLFIRDTTIQSSAGIKEGITDPYALCRNYEYSGFTKVCSPDCSRYFYTCYTLLDNSNGCKKYMLGDGETYCMTSFTGGVIFDSNANYSKYGNGNVGNFELQGDIGNGRANEQECREACIEAGFSKSALVVVGGSRACMCIKK